MKISPLLVGALAIAPIIGAFAGHRMSAEPLTTATDVTAALPDRPHYARADAAPKTTPRLPDHYAMETPEGRVEVHELAMRGRFHNRYDALDRYQARTEENLAYLEARWDYDELDKRAEQALASDGYRYRPEPTANADREIAHYSASEQARTGEAVPAASPRLYDGPAITQPVEPGPVEIAAPQPRSGQPKVVDVRRELALRQ